MGQATPFDLRLTALIEPTVEGLGFELVRVRLQGSSGQHRVLQIMAERPDGTMSVDDCAELSRAVSVALDVEDPIDGAYDLEVSSPGIDRPLTRLKDFEVWSGFEAKVELATPVDGRKRFKGRLKGVEGETFRIETQIEGEGSAVVALPFCDLAEARLVITDDLLKAAARTAQGSIGQGQDIDADEDGIVIDGDEDETPH